LRPWLALRVSVILSRAKYIIAIFQDNRSKSGDKAPATASGSTSNQTGRTSQPLPRPRSPPPDVRPRTTTHRSGAAEKPRSFPRNSWVADDGRVVGSPCIWLGLRRQLDKVIACQHVQLASISKI